MTRKDKNKRTYDNWAEIEMEYVTDSNQTYESLSQKYGPQPKAVCRHAKAGKWREKRLAFEERKIIVTQQKLAEMQGKESADEIVKMNKSHYESQQALKYLADKQIIADVDKVIWWQDVRPLL